MADKSKLTPVMQQYVDFKGENPDALLMFRLGDFYESFFEDAKTISAKLGLVLTSRGTDADGEDIPMCGIPWHAAETYFGRLVRAGYKLALVEQMETPAQAKERGHKFIERKINTLLMHFQKFPQSTLSHLLLQWENGLMNGLLNTRKTFGAKKLKLPKCNQKPVQQVPFTVLLQQVR